MKNVALKISVIAAAVFALLSTASFAFSDTSTTAIYGTPKIDGEIDAIWEKAYKEDVVLIDTESDLGGYKAIPTNTTGVLRTMWDEDNFYILVEVDKHNLPLSIYYGMENKGEDNVSVCIGLDGFFGADVFNGGNPNSGVFRVILSGEKSGHGTGFDRFFHDYRGKMVKTSDTTYVVEYAFPWPTVGYTLNKDSVVALDIQINVADSGKRIGVVTWASTPATTWNQFWECGTVYLEGIESMDFPTKAETLPAANPKVIECFGDLGYNGIDLADGTEIATRFEVQSGTIEDIVIECPSWGDNKGHIDIRLYKWINDYATTVAQSPIAEIEHENFPDNSALHLKINKEKNPLQFGKDEYLLWIGNDDSKTNNPAGVYIKEANATDPRVIATYIDGVSTDKIGMKAKIYLSNSEAIIYPDSTADETTEESTVEETTVDTTAEETTVEDTTAEETTVEDTTAEDTTAEETTVKETTVEETTAEETTAEETTAEETDPVAPPTADYMALAALAVVAFGAVLTLGKKK